MSVNVFFVRPSNASVTNASANVFGQWRGRTPPRVLDARAAARIDIRLDAAGEPSFIEINPLPGLHHVHSDLPILARQQGMSFRALIGAIVASALERAPRR